MPDKPNPMDQALALARDAARLGEVPVGAVVVAHDGTVLSQAHNLVESARDPTAHAEIVALRQAASLRAEKWLPDATLYVTLEPCAMCAAAISQFRIRRLVFAAYDPKGGAVEHGPRWFQQPTCLHQPEVVGGVREGAAAALLRAFFADLRGTR